MVFDIMPAHLQTVEKKAKERNPSAADQICAPLSPTPTREHIVAHCRRVYALPQNNDVLGNTMVGVSGVLVCDCAPLRTLPHRAACFAPLLEKKSHQEQPRRELGRPRRWHRENSRPRECSTKRAVVVCWNTSYSARQRKKRAPASILTAAQAQ